MWINYPPNNIKILLVEYGEKFLDNNVVMAEVNEHINNVEVKLQDYLTVRFDSYFSSYDMDSLVSLYGPVIGYEAVSLYLFMLSEAKLEQVNHEITHEQFLNRIGMNIDIFNMARQQLEGMGLVSTYQDKNDDCTFYHYVLKQPYPPFEFVNSPLYYGVLKRSIGEDEALKIVSLYETDEGDVQGEDVSSSFSEVYNPIYDSKPFIPEATKNNLKRKNVGEIKSSFSESDFFLALDSLSFPNPISKGDFSDKELKEIQRFADLYGVSESEIARAVYINYKSGEPYGQRIKSRDLKRQLDYQSEFKVSQTLYTENLEPNLISSRSDLANKINDMELMAPIKYLKNIQHGADVAPADSRVLNNISATYMLPNPVLNALVTYTLETQHNTLPNAYMEKIAAALNREGVKTAADALNYLYGTKKKTSKANVKNTTNDETNEKDVKIEKEKKKINNTDEEWEKLFKKLENGGK